MKKYHEQTEEENPGFVPYWVSDLVIKILFWLMIGGGIFAAITVVLVVLFPTPEVRASIGELLQMAVMSPIFFAIAAAWKYWYCSGRWKQF